jgi:hypothetical protein
MSICTVDRCELPTRSKTADLCAKHYMRWYRHGDPEATMTGDGFTLSRGRRYRTRLAPEHSLAMANGKVYVHRAVLYDDIGPRAHPCHWCGTTLLWKADADDQRLTVDHLNDDGADNRPENLVPSCRSCNIGRALIRKAAARRAKGWWHGKDATRPRMVERGATQTSTGRA